MLSTVYEVSAAFPHTGSAAAGIVAALRDRTLPSNGDKNDSSSKPRDGYGRKVGAGDDGAFAKEEGGIVVCLPEAKGPMYAHSRNELKKDDNRTANSMKKKSPMKGKCFFATRNGEPKKLEQSGTLYIYAFDSNYRDNAGSYEVKFRIKRSQ